MSSYEDGKLAALNHPGCAAEAIRKLKTDPDFWQGFHDNRPKSAFSRPLIDPTRPGGWCFVDTSVPTVLKQGNSNDS